MPRLKRIDNGCSPPFHAFSGESVLCAETIDGGLFALATFALEYRDDRTISIDRNVLDDTEFPAALRRVKEQIRALYRAETWPKWKGARNDAKAQ